MLIHGRFVGLVNENVVFVSDLFDLGLHHAIVIIETVIGIFSFTNCQLQLLFDLFLYS